MAAEHASTHVEEIFASLKPAPTLRDLLVAQAHESLSCSGRTEVGRAIAAQRFTSTLLEMLSHCMRLGLYDEVGPSATAAVAGMDRVTGISFAAVLQAYAALQELLPMPEFPVTDQLDYAIGTLAGRAQTTLDHLPEGMLAQGTPLYAAQQRLSEAQLQTMALALRIDPAALRQKLIDPELGSYRECVALAAPLFGQQPENQQAETLRERIINTALVGETWNTPSTNKPFYWVALGEECGFRFGQTDLIMLGIIFRAANAHVYLYNALAQSVKDGDSQTRSQRIQTALTNPHDPVVAAYNDTNLILDLARERTSCMFRNRLGKQMA
jgi:hypothetical protein